MEGVFTNVERGLALAGEGGGPAARDYLGAASGPGALRWEFEAVGGDQGADGPSGTDIDAAMSSVQTLWQASVAPAVTRSTAGGFLPGPIMEARDTAARRIADRHKRTADMAGISAIRPPLSSGPQGTAPTVRWPTKCHRASRPGCTAREREEAEDTERKRWLARLADAVSRANLPAVQLAGGDKERLAKRVGQARRTNTLRRRTRDWEKFARFLHLSLGVVFPSGASDVLLYLGSLEDAGAPASQIDGAWQALAFVEKAGGVLEADGLRKNPALASAFQEAFERAASLTVHRGPAPRLSLAFLPALERIVTDPDGDLYPRLLAWVRLLKVWAVLRGDDLQGLSPDSMALGPSGLSGTLTRTKTSGSGRRQETLPVWVEKGACFQDPAWLSVGFSLWQAQDVKRDFLVLLPSENR